MRVSAAAWLCQENLQQMLQIAAITAVVSHNHPEGIKGAVVTAGATYLARTGASMEEIRAFVASYYDIGFTLDAIRDTYRFNETCMDTVPQAMVAFLESSSFEDAIRNGISIGGDSDTLCAITGAVAEAYYGVSEEERRRAVSYLDERLCEILFRFEEKYGAMRK
jgi:type I restriction enzyme M protein